MEPAPQTWLDTRTAGVLAHLSSLPGDYGIGNLGPGARSFVDFLAESGVRYWQICPIGPTGYGDLPYQVFSGRARNPYFIDLGVLLAAGLLAAPEVARRRQLPAGRLGYGPPCGRFGASLVKALD